MTRKRDVSVMLLCNFPQNGTFTGHVSEINLTEYEVHLECFSEPGPVLKFRKSSIQVGQRKFHIASHKEWVGNWCWDEVSMPINEAEKMLWYLQSRSGRQKWNMTSGPSSAMETWQKNEKVFL